MIFQPKYQFKEGFRCNVTIGAVMGVFDELTKQKKLNAKTLVEVSQSEDAPLHRYFEWDDAKCGKNWREQQARVLIAHVEVKDADNEQAEPVRAFFITESETGLYEPITAIVKSEDKLQDLYDMAKKELRAFQKKYSGIKAFAKLFEDIDRLPDRCS